MCEEKEEEEEGATALFPWLGHRLADRLGESERDETESAASADGHVKKENTSLELLEPLFFLGKSQVRLIESLLPWLEVSDNFLGDSQKFEPFDFHMHLIAFLFKVGHFSTHFTVAALPSEIVA